MSLETRSNSALFKRADQLKRWEDSDTNREPVSPKHASRKIKFSSGCVFLAACAAAEKDEVLRLIEQGADIDTANVDGLTALHQACIDDNLDMVEFLVEQGADVNRGDNEGWTPLHATASCGFLSIAKYLLEHGGDVAAVNCDGELALDIAECEAMEELLQAEIDEQGIDCDQARTEEERLMLRDALEWYSGKSSKVNDSSPKTGATPLHVAAAKGYVDVIKVILQCDVDIDKQDVDGWTPLHAAAHWGQKEASQMLTEHLADMDSKNYVGQTAFDVANGEMYVHLGELMSAQNKEEIMNKRQAKKRQEVKDSRIDSSETPTKVQKVDLEDSLSADNIEKKNRVNASLAITSAAVPSLQQSAAVDSLSSLQQQTSSDVVVVATTTASLVAVTPTTTITTSASTTTTTSPTANSNKGESGEKVWKNERSNRTTMPENETTTTMPAPTTTPTTLKSSKSFNSKDKDINEVKLRKNYSFQNDPKFYERYREVRARIQATSSLPNYTSALSSYIIPPTTTTTSLHPSNHPYNITTQTAAGVATGATGTGTGGATVILRRTHSNPGKEVRSSDNLSISTTSPTSLSPATSPLPNNQSMKIRSFVPPVRDEESETQRKARAKKHRETRRSTQGVTLEEIKSAEQFVKRVNNNNNNETVTQPPVTTTTTTATTTTADSNNSVTVSATITTAAGSATVAPVVTAAPPLLASSDVGVTSAAAGQERRPSWRLRLDNGSKFKLEDAAANTTATLDPSQSGGNVTIATPASPSNNTPSFMRRQASSAIIGASNNGGGNLQTTRPSSAPVMETATEATVTLSLRNRTTKAALEEKDQDKENDVRNAHQMAIPTQAAIQRRRRSKRRSTGGVVAFENLEDIETEKDFSGGGGGGGDFEDSTKINNSESGNDSRSNRSSRISSANDITHHHYQHRGENGEIDYKKLYEQTLVDNDRLKDKLRKSDEELRDTKQTLERLNTVTSKNSLSELEKRERRAMERKLSEMEEELKHVDLLRTENQRLKDENGALIRVISKLSK